MRKKLCGFFAGLPVPVMLGAAVTFAVHLLKENHHNSTIPLFSVLFACSFSLLAFMLTASAAFCLYRFLKTGNPDSRYRLLAVMGVLHLLFAVLCVFVIEAYFVPAAFYLLGTALCLLTALIFCKFSAKPE